MKGKGDFKMNASDFRAEARTKLNGKWGKAALIAFAYMLVFFVIGLLQGFIAPEGSSLENLVSLIVIIIEIPLAFGLVISFIKLFKGDDVKAFDFLSTGFSNFKKSWTIALNIVQKMIVPIILMVIAYALIISGIVAVVGSGIVSHYSAANATAVGAVAGSVRTVFILGIILLIVAGILGTIKSYYYQLAYMIAAENPEMTGKEAVLKSQELMQNRRWKLFCLQLSFIGWAILAVISFGIGFFWLIPYMQFATIAFYKNALGEPVNEEKQEVISEQ